MAVSENIKVALQALEDEIGRARVLAESLRAAVPEHSEPAVWVYQFDYLVEAFQSRCEAVLFAVRGGPDPDHGRAAHAGLSRQQA